MPDVSQPKTKFDESEPCLQTEYAERQSLAMNLALGADACRTGACWTERGLACPGRPPKLACSQRRLGHQQRYSERCNICASAFRPCIDIHQASAYAIHKHIPCSKSNVADTVHYEGCFANTSGHHCLRDLVLCSGSREADCRFLFKGPPKAQAGLPFPKLSSLE